MKEFDECLGNIKEAKKVSLGYKIGAIQQLILQRYQALITISSISFAMAGIILATNSSSFQNKSLAFLALIVFMLVAIFSLGRYLDLLRDDINGLAKRIKGFPKENWSHPLKEKDFKLDYWPESLYLILIAGILLFSFSFINFSL